MPSFVLQLPGQLTAHETKVIQAGHFHAWLQSATEVPFFNMWEQCISETFWIGYVRVSEDSLGL